MFSSSLPPVVCKRAHECLIYVTCVCLREVVSNTYCIVFCFVFLRLVSCYHKLPVSLDCPFLITLSVFSNVYFNIARRHISTMRE